MNNPISPNHNSEPEDEEESSSSSWSEITAPSSPFSDASDTSSWILIPKIALEVNDDNNDDSQEDDDSQEEDTESYYSQNLQEEEEESSEELEIMYQKGPSSSSSSSSRPSSETFISVLIRERVLHRLPAKQLLKLRTVSRQWNDFITSPFFIHSHSQSSISISGVFYIRPSAPINSPSFNPFNKDLHGLQSPELKFLPEPVAVLSSSRGLLCCQGFSDETTKYFIVNPITGSWVLLPPPANNHGIKPAAVIVFDEPFMFNFTLDYKLVVAYDLGVGCYGFEIFRSREWEWSVSSELCVTEEIVPESGVAAGGCAHWRTSMQTVVSYNPEMDKNWDVVWPESYREDVSWELMEIDGKLSCVCVKDDEVCVYGSEGSGWKEVRKRRMMGKWGSGEVKVVRVQEVKEVVVVEKGRVWGWSLEDGKWREGDWFVGEGCEKFVSFVGSLLHAYGSWG